MLEPKDITILVVDDEEYLRKAIVMDFKRKGFNVLSAENGTEAYELIKANKIHLVLSDVRMPNGDGIELLDRLKELDPDVPIFMFITGFTDMSAEEAYHRGADAIFSKPFDRKSLMEAVIKAISNKLEIWSERKEERIRTNCIIDLQFPSLKISMESKVLNLGRGGMFVSLKNQFPEVGQQATFSIKFNEGSVSSIEGGGLVRWVREEFAENQLAGCGIEFQYLTEQGRKQVVEVIKSLKTKSFIPKA